MQYPPDRNPQQPYGQQPYPSQPGFVPQPLPQGYAQPGQMQPPFIPPPQKPKKPKRWPWILALVVVFFVGFGIGSATHGSSSPDTTATTTQTGGGTSTQPAPTTKPAAPAKWTTTHTFSGSGSKKTAVFAIGDDWKIVWSCKPSSFDGGQYNVIVSVTNSDNTPADPAAVNTLCKAGNTGDTTEEHTGGNVYLDVTSEADWTITVQELK